MRPAFTASNTLEISAGRKNGWDTNRAADIVITRHILFIGGTSFDGRVCRGLEQKGYIVRRVDDCERAVDLLIGSRVDLVILDLDEVVDGAGFIGRIRRIPMFHRTRVLALGDWGSGKPTLALSAGADAYEPLPIDAKGLTEAVERILNARAAVVGLNR